jgi:hypothetical protein
MYDRFGHCFMGEPGWESAVLHIVGWLHRTLDLPQRHRAVGAGAVAGGA